MSADMPEPGDLTVLYWPETEVATAAVAVRDDTAYGVKYGAEGDAHWWTFGLGKVGPLTWGELWAACHQGDAPIAEATVLTSPAEPAAYALAARAGWVAYVHDIQACGHVEWFRTPPVDGGCEACESGSLDPADWQPLYVATTAPAEPTGAEIQAAARAIGAALLAGVDNVDVRELRTWARLALTAAAQVRAGVDDEDES